MITSPITSLAAKPFRIGATAIVKALTHAHRTPSVASLASPCAIVSAIRGGAAAAASSFDFDRSIVRLDAIGAYPVVAAIMMSAMLDMSMDTPKVIKKIPPEANKSTALKTRIENTATCLFSLVNILSIVAAAYSTVVFTLIVIYSKTAIGMELDSAFLNFFAAMEPLRYSAFKCFVHSMIGFIISLGLSRFLKETGIVRWIESLTTFVVSVIGLVKYKFILDTAQALIYNS